MSIATYRKRTTNVPSKGRSKERKQQQHISPPYCNSVESATENAIPVDTFPASADLGRLASFVLIMVMTMSGATDALCEDGPIFTTTTDKIDEADLLQSKAVLIHFSNQNQKP
ncbi:hypothetical protein T12_5936 [Trichinella patagoniensis]|uniref:Uncharacterized protein n=1 Tax=Trichinella patagoniensis TaxID=990121 RepID=A0A0V0ZZX0_9BILA|nr:hypothetical protein T12_5936 [Trichinella patagoniensis]